MLLKIRRGKINDQTERTKKLLMLKGLYMKNIYAVIMIVLSIHNNSLHPQIDRRVRYACTIFFFGMKLIFWFGSILNVLSFNIQLHFHGLPELKFLLVLFQFSLVSFLVFQANVLVNLQKTQSICEEQLEMLHFGS